jgi:uncharacterized membrane-anchored protein YjiN (DUF445 family)
METKTEEGDSDRPARRSAGPADLQAAQRKATLLLLAAAVLFGATLLVPNPNLAVRALRAMSEAALVGGLADWFAVRALFHRIPVPLIGRHTAIVPQNKDRIADELARFVQRHFLDPASLVALMRRHDPLQALTAWLRTPAARTAVARAMRQAFQGALRLVDERTVARLMGEGTRQALERVDLSASAGELLHVLTGGGKHQELLERLIEQGLAYVRTPQAQDFVARSIVRWLKSDHPAKEKVLPTRWLGGKGADLLVDGLAQLLADVRDNPAHELRGRFDEWVLDLTARLRSDPALRERAAQLKSELLSDAQLADYLASVWNDVRAWLLADLDKTDSAVASATEGAAQWLGHKLAEDPELRATLNAYLEAGARRLAPELGEFLTAHIRDTVRGWDARELALQIEASIGKDLQFVRINGTFVGGAIGLLLFAAVELAHGR